jgi:hypothetical protein
MPRDPYPKACLAWVGSHRFAKEEAVAKEVGQAMSKFSLVRVGL